MRVHSIELKVKGEVFKVKGLEFEVQGLGIRD